MAVVRTTNSNVPSREASVTGRPVSESPEDLRQALEEDPDNPPWTEQELALAQAGRFVRQTREATGLSQEKFGERFQINPARLRDWEQGRHMPDSAALAYLKVIRRNRTAVEQALGLSDLRT